MSFVLSSSFVGRKEFLREGFPPSTLVSFGRLLRHAGNTETCILSLHVSGILLLLQKIRIRGRISLIQFVFSRTCKVTSKKKRKYNETETITKIYNKKMNTCPVLTFTHLTAILDSRHSQLFPINFPCLTRNVTLCLTF